MACNFPGHPLSHVHTGSADPMETCPFLQPLQSGFHSRLKTSWSLWFMSCMAGVGKEHFSAFLFSLTYELLLPNKSMSPAQDWKSGAVSTSSLSPFLGERQHLFLFFFFLSLPIPSFIHSEGTFEDRKFIYKLSSYCLHNGRCLWLPRIKRQNFQDVISKWHSKMGVSHFFPFPSLFMIQGLQWVLLKDGLQDLKGFAAPATQAWGSIQAPHVTSQVTMGLSSVPQVNKT